MDPDLCIAIIVNPALPLGLIANTVGAISIGLGAHRPELGASLLTDRQGRSIHVSANRPVPILQAGGDTIAALLLTALAHPSRGTVVPFPAFARALHAYADYEASFPDRDLADEAIDGLGLAGPRKWVKSLTGSLKLLR